MKNAYLLPCSCGRQCEVDAGQAGTQIACSCGELLTVPSIRGLRQLKPVAESAAPAAAPWNPARGAIFSLGLLVAVGALLFTSYQGYWFFITRRTQDPAAIQLQMEFDHIDHLTPVDSMGLFRSEEKSGLGEPSPPRWAEIDKLHESSRRLGIIGMIVAGVGLLATAGSMVGCQKKSA
jgi:hypothetical protein